MLRCIIVDDEPPAVDLLREYASKVGFLELEEVFHNSLKALDFLKNHDIDLVFMDINMPDLNGMSLSKLIPVKTKVIFTTAYPEFALESYKVDAIDYLLKPIAFEDYLNSVNKAKEYFDLRNADNTPVEGGQEFIFIKADYKLHKILWQDILFVENQKDYVKFYLENGKSLMTLMSLKSLEEKMPNSMFLKVHRSYIVGLNYLNVIERNRIHIGKHLIPVSDAYKSQLQDYLNS